MLIDKTFRDSLSDIAKKAVAIVGRIKLEEQQTLWTKQYEDSLADQDGDIYPGMMFSLAKDRMESSKLFKIIRKMPKGALLHCHLEAMVEFKYILEDAFKLDCIYLKSSTSLNTPEALSKASVGFCFSESPLQTTSISIWDAEYKADDLVSLNEAADTFPEGGRSGFIDWMNSRCTITPDESIRHHDGPNEIWRKFFSAFGVIRTIIYHPTIFRGYVLRLCQQLHADGVEWADVRAVFYDQALGPHDQRMVELIGVFGEVVEAFKQSEEGKGFWGMRVIWTWPRVFSSQSMIYGKCSQISHCVYMFANNVV